MSEALSTQSAAATAGSRGRLTVYFGAAPGVGKTYAMLERAQALRRAGTRVLVGVAVTHGRTETAALLDGLERVPERTVAMQGLALAEFDLATALRLRPAVLILDELAHSNAPGSRHAKRWQDAEELLDAGIDVLTTLNVQHVESLREPVARLTGVEVRERVPDRFLDRADAIELVDLPTEELLARLKTGKVYAGEAVGRALTAFFTADNLAGLRELALRYVAGRVHAAADVTAARQPAERLLVAIGPSPTSARLVRSAKRMADATGASWLAVHAQTPTTLHLDTQARMRLGEHMRLAESLGAMTVTVGGDSVARALIEAAQRHGARRILVGKPARSRLIDMWRGSLIHDLIRLSGDLEVLAITGDEVAEAAATDAHVHEQRDEPRQWWPWIWSVVVVLIAAVTVIPLRGYLQPVNLILPFLIAVVSIGLTGQRGPMAMATVLGVLAFDVLCVPPYGSLTVYDSEYLLTFCGMLVVGLTIAHLVARLRLQADHALDEAEGAAALHRLGSGLATTRGSDALVQTSGAIAGDILGCRATVLVTDATDSPGLTHEAILRLADDGSAISAPELAVAQWVAQHGRAAGVGTDTLPSAQGLHLPLSGSGAAMGVLVLTGMHANRVSDPAWRRLAESAARLIALALACERLHVRAGEEQSRAERERLRATLLAGVSHDLRTPLTAIAGLAQQLANDGDPERRRTAQTIAEQADRLAATVRNMLELARLTRGAVHPRRVPLAAEDALAAAVAAVRPGCAGRVITVSAADCPPIAADETLLHVALVNLLDNALVHGAGPITVTARVDADATRVAMTVADRGPGVLIEDRERIFEAWQRGQAARPGGAGLGLALVRAVVEAHGGTITVADHVDGGAAFTLTLPRHAEL